MITNMHNIYSQTLTPSFQARVPKTKPVLNCKNAAVDQFAGKQQAQNKQTIVGVLKNIFFETFPKLDPEYKNVSKKFKTTKPVNVKEKRTEPYFSNNVILKERRGKTYTEADMSEYGIDNTGYGFGNTGK